MALVFYFVPHSTSNVTAAVLAELEHDQQKPLARRVELSIQAGDTRKPDYLSSVNPNGRVPAIVHDGTAIWESAAITMYLGEMFGIGKEGAGEGSGLYPAPGPRRGEAMKWIVWANTTLAAAGSRLAAALPVGSPGGVEQGSRDEEGKEEKEHANAEKAARAEIAKALAILDGALNGREFLLGSLYCLADTHIWSFVSWLTMMGTSMESYSNVRDWLAKVGARPALKNL